MGKLCRTLAGNLIHNCSGKGYQMTDHTSGDVARNEPLLISRSSHGLVKKLELETSRGDLILGSLAGVAVVTAIGAIEQRPWARLTAQSNATAASTGTATVIPTTIAALEAEHFAALVGESFRVTASSSQATLVLRDVVVAEPGGDARPSGVRTGGFPLLFEVVDGSLTESGIVTTSHEQSGRHELFLHRVGPEDGSAARYEVVFN